MFFGRSFDKKLKKKGKANKQGLQWTPEEETMNTVILFVIDSVM